MARSLPEHLGRLTAAAARSPAAKVRERTLEQAVKLVLLLSAQNEDCHLWPVPPSTSRRNHVPSRFRSVASVHLKAL